MTSKEFYCLHPRENLPLFHRPFWLDAAAGSDWNVAVVKEGENIIASMPFAFEKKSLGLFIRGPHLTQFLGPHYQIESKNPREYLNREVDLLNELIAQIPPFAFFEQRWHFDYQNYLPLHWKDFQQKTRYTYVLTPLNNTDSLWNDFSEKIKREITKAEKQFHCESEHISVAAFYELVQKNLSHKKYELPFTTDFLEGLYQACRENNAGKIYLALDANEKIVAGIFVAWDSSSAYYIIGGKDRTLGNNGAMSFLFWNAFMELGSKVPVFNFEGSMIEGVENYFRSFGSLQKTFFEISRVDSKLFFVSREIKKTSQFLFKK